MVKENLQHKKVSILVNLNKVIKMDMDNLDG